MSNITGSATGGENLRGIIDHVLSEFPNYDVGLITRKANLHLRNVLNRRVWSGVTSNGFLPVPAAFSTGTMDLTRLSAAVTGTATAWPVSDLANTTLSADVAETGNQNATPVSMAGIVPGRYVLVDTAGDQEAVFVISVTETTFLAKFAKTHLSGVAVTRSSLANLQLRKDFQSFYTVAAVVSATSLLLESTWAGSSSSLNSYQIALVYTDFGVRDCRQLLSVVNPSQQLQMQLYVPREVLDREDPHRANEGAGGWTYVVAPYKADPGGVPLYELWPRPTSETQFPFTYKRMWPTLADDYDQLPNGIQSDYIVAMICADAYRWPPHKKIDKGIYYDPKAGKDKLQEAMGVYLPLMMAEDDAAFMRDITYGTSGGYPGQGAAYRQMHDFDAWD